MKKLLLTLLITGLFQVNAQKEKFVINEENPTFPPQFVVIQKDGMSIEEGFNRAIEWINVTYKNPAEVIKSEIKDKYIRIEGYASGLYIADRMGLIPPYDVKYVISFNFKDGKVKFEVDSSTFYIPPSSATSGGWYGLVFNNSALYRKNGKPKYELKKAEKVIAYFNNLSSSFQNYVNNPVEDKADNDDW